MTAEWMGRRWFEFRTGYTTYITFMFGFSNFILILYGLTDWFKALPVHVFAIVVFSIILPISILIGHNHVKYQQKTESRQLHYHDPYKNTAVPESKEILYIIKDVVTLECLAELAGDKELAEKIKKIKIAMQKMSDGGHATNILKDMKL